MISCFSERRQFEYSTISLLVLVLVCATNANAQDANSLDRVLQRRAAALRGQVSAIDRQIASINLRLPPLRDEIDRLIEEADGIKLPSPEEEVEEPKEPPPREVKFRPPFLREVDLDTPLAIVCKNNRIAILDFEAFGEAFDEIMDDRAAVAAFVDKGGGNIPAGDFEMKISLIQVGSSIFLRQEAIQKSEGEPAEVAIRPNSQFARRLKDIDPEESVIQFAAYPDSFEDFRTIRTLLWDRGFAINWNPMKHGEVIGVGSGGGVSAQ